MTSDTLTSTEPPVSNLLTHSRLRAYRKCARLEHLRYVEGWQPVTDSEALLFGRLWHEGMEAWWLAHQRGEPHMALTEALMTVGGKAADLFVQVKCEELLRGYDTRWHDQRYTVTGVEREFGTVLVNPVSMLRSRTWRLGGKIDAQIQTPDARYFIVEHKTSSEDITPGADYWIKLQLDNQLSIYMIGAESLGEPPEGALYDVVKKVQLQPFKATPPESRKFTKDGRLYANQHDADETPEEYRVRVREAITAEPERYFQRRDIPRTESQLAEFLADAWAQGKTMHEAHLANRAPRSPESCFAYGKCSYWDLCSTGANPADMPDRYRRVENVHPELSEVEAA